MSRGPGRWALLFAAVVLSIGVGYLAGSLLWRDSSESGRPAPPPAARPSISYLPEVSLAGLDGRDHRLSEWKNRPVLLNFWASWCAPCREELPLLETVSRSVPAKELQIIGIAIDAPADAEAFALEAGITYPILVGRQKALETADQFGSVFVGLPFSVVAAPGGRVVRVHTGALSAADLRDIANACRGLQRGTMNYQQARAALSGL